MTDTLLSINNLYLNFRTFDGVARVLNGVSLTIQRGDVLGLVGETGCGKTLTGLSISRLVPTPPGEYPRGEIWFDGRDLMQASEAEMQRLRGRRISMIFQDPTTNLNPVFTIAQQMEDVALHLAEVDGALLGRYLSGRGRRQAARARSLELLDKVGIVDAAQRMDAYPYEFSGGMRQRVLIAMALLGKPVLLIADEPTTALDVSVQAQILRLIFGLVREFDLSVLLITHNLGVVAQLCTRVAVMYAGNVVESGTAQHIFRRPSHPYTRALLASVPTAQTPRGALAGVAGNIPNLIHPPPGCRFAPRCPHVMPVCDSAFPTMAQLEAGHAVGCYLYPAEAHDEPSAIR
jgi:oligopeptide/dipeptide ABC transporter ATP-binding protein